MITAQPSSAAASSGMSGEIFTTPFSCSSICSDQPKMLEPHWLMRWPFQDITGSSSRARPGRFVQTLRWPVRHISQWPQKVPRAITWSPGWT